MSRWPAWISRAALCCAVLSGVSQVEAAGFPAPLLQDGLFDGRVIPVVAFDGSNYDKVYDARIYKKCRKKVRRTLGKARGKNVKAYRLAYIQQCMINGGTHW